MLAVDVTVLVSAFREDASDHAEMRQWLEEAVAGLEPLGITDAVLGASVRIVTNPRIFPGPTPTGIALDEATRLREQDGVVTLAPGPRHWSILQGLCREVGARGNLVTDAQHAAVAVEHGATRVSKDGDSARFTSLRWRHPLDGA